MPVRLCLHEDGSCSFSPALRVGVTPRTLCFRRLRNRRCFLRGLARLRGGMEPVGLN